MVERLLAGHRDGKRAVVDCLDLLDERLRLVVVAERHRHDGRVAISRDEPGARVVEVRARTAESRDLAVVDEVAHERLNRGESTAYASERMTTTSVKPSTDRAGTRQAERRLRVPTRGCW